MDVLTFDTDRHPATERAESWQHFICDMIHNVAVNRFSATDFSAQISARRDGNVSCAEFRSRPHDIAGRGERASDAGGAGYLLSWQLEGTAYITQGDTRIVLHPGELAVIDGRLPMAISFPDNVNRIVAKLPVQSIESRLPNIRRSHAFALRPSGPFSDVLLSYLKELSSGTQDLSADEIGLLSDNVCNLLKITSRQGGVASSASRDLQREAVLNYMHRRASDPGLSLDVAAGQLNMSTRLVQKLLQELETTFTAQLNRERLALATQMLSAQPQDPVSHVAFSAGFNDVSHFNHLFRREHGVSPTAWRAAAQQRP
jgi:AraC family transcriptional regulator, positive regulator of tynA and feaB